VGVTSFAWWRSRETLLALLTIAVVTLLTRFWVFGNPVFMLDEQFYLFVGDRMLDGQLPYLDIWDRKPIGLFAIYAFAALFPDPVLTYLLLAAFCAGMTAWIVFTVARRFASFGAALAGAAAYPAWLLVFAGIGGQSPVYYNLPMALAAVLTMTAYGRADDHGLTRRGCAIMLLAGIAMQIKYAAVFEGVFFGLTLLWIGWRRGRGLTRVAAAGALWITVALAPTLAILAYYAALGHGEAFLQANFYSVLTDINLLGPALLRLLGLTLGFSPLAFCAWYAWRHWRNLASADARRVRWLFSWALASLFGFVAFGLWYDHYVLPLLPPLCVLAALGFDRMPRRGLAIALVIGLGWLGGTGRSYVIEYSNGGNADEAERMVRLVEPHLGGRCLYVNEDLPYLYRETGACLPTRYTFPQHLAMWRYREGLGVDQLAEMQRLLASRPGVIVVKENPDEDTRRATRSAMLAVLRRDYRAVGRAPLGAGRYTVYALNTAEGRQEGRSARAD
jgi:hypothetical protein